MIGFQARWVNKNQFKPLSGIETES